MAGLDRCRYRRRIRSVVVFAGPRVAVLRAGWHLVVEHRRPGGGRFPVRGTRAAASTALPRIYGSRSERLKTFAQNISPRLNSDDRTAQIVRRDRGEAFEIAIGAFEITFRRLKNTNGPRQLARVRTQHDDHRNHQAQRLDNK